MAVTLPGDYFENLKILSTAIDHFTNKFLYRKSLRDIALCSVIKDFVSIFHRRYIKIVLTVYTTTSTNHNYFFIYKKKAVIVSIYIFRIYLDKISVIKITRASIMYYFYLGCSRQILITRYFF